MHFELCWMFFCIDGSSFSYWVLMILSHPSSPFLIFGVLLKIFLKFSSVFNFSLAGIWSRKLLTTLVREKETMLTAIDWALSWSSGTLPPHYSRSPTCVYCVFLLVGTTHRALKTTASPSPKFVEFRCQWTQELFSWCIFGIFLLWGRVCAMIGFNN